MQHLTHLAAIAVLACAPLLAPPPALARDIAGVTFADSATAHGSPVFLVGVGVRTKWMMNIYAMGVYQATVKKAAGHIAAADEPKLLQLKVLRGIGGDKMKDAIDDGVEKNTSSADRDKLTADLGRLKAAFPADIPKGLVIEFAYTPGRGTSLRLGGSEKLVVAGRPFMVAVWRIWVGSNPADKGLRDSVLE